MGRSRNTSPEGERLRGYRVGYGGGGLRGWVVDKRDWYFIADQPAPAPHLARPEGRDALTVVGKMQDLTVLYLALTVLYLALAVLYIALTVLYPKPKRRRAASHWTWSSTTPRGS